MIEPKNFERSSAISNIERAVRSAEARRSRLRPPGAWSRLAWGLGGVILGASALYGAQQLPMIRAAPPAAQLTAAQVRARAVMYRLLGLPAAGAKKTKLAKKAASAFLAGYVDHQARFHAPMALRYAPTKAPTRPSIFDPGVTRLGSYSAAPQPSLKAASHAHQGRPVTGHYAYAQAPLPGVLDPLTVNLRAFGSTAMTRWKPAVKSKKPARIQRQQFVAITQRTATPDTEQRKLADLAASLGGTSAPFTVPDESGSGQGIVAYVPVKMLSKLLRAASHSGDAVDVNAWAGASAPRTDALEQDLVGRIEALKKKRDDLLTTFYEDAVPVQHVDADIAAATKSLTELRSLRAPAGDSAVRILFVKA